MDEVAAWAASGAMALTGRALGPALGPPAPLVPRMMDLGNRIARLTTELGKRVTIDTLALLGERAALARLTRNGTTSCGGGTRLLAAADGWIAVTLARPDDIELIPAWLEGADSANPDPWQTVTAEASKRSALDLESRAALLGLPVATLPAAPPLAAQPLRAIRLGDAWSTERLGEVVVADLSSLWAGPLCGSLLASAGAAVRKVESVTRPDGARQGPRAFFALLNAQKEATPIEFTRDAVLKVLSEADVVIEASRPRALEQLGIDADTLVRSNRPRVWLSITAHGREGAGRDRVGFGDDAAVAGGLVAWEDGEPRFCADAIADPLTGLFAAEAVLDALAVGGRWLIEVSMCGVAASVAGPTLPVRSPVIPAPPRARAPRQAAGRPTSP